MSQDYDQRYITWLMNEYPFSFWHI